MSAVAELPRHVADGEALRVSLICNLGLMVVGVSIESASFRDLPAYTPFRDTSTAQGMLGESQMPHALTQAKEIFGACLDLTPEPVSREVNNVVFQRTDTNVTLLTRNPGRDTTIAELEVDGLLAIDGLVVPWEVKTTTHDNGVSRAMHPRRINKVIESFQPFFPGRKFGYLVAAPRDAFYPPYLSQTVQQEPGFMTHTQKFINMGGTIAILPEPQGGFHEYAASAAPRQRRRA